MDDPEEEAHMEQDAKGGLRRIVNNEDREGLVRIYDSWAETYDREMVTQRRYRGYLQAVEAFVAEGPDPEARIADYGCGSGLVGEELARRGYRRIEGFDISAGMLEAARQKGVYQELHQADLTRPLELLSGCYDHLLCAGTFGSGHLHAEHFDELLRTIRAGGLAAIFMNCEDHERGGFGPHFRRLEQEGAWSIRRTIRDRYIDTLEREGVVIVGEKR